MSIGAGEYHNRADVRYPVRRIAPHPDRRNVQDPLPLDTQYPVRPNAQYPVQPNAQYPVQPHAQYPVQPHAQYPVQPHAQYPVQTNAQYLVGTDNRKIEAFEQPIKQSADPSSKSAMANPAKPGVKGPLTEEERRRNHTRSETNRRNKMKEASKELANTVPDMKDYSNAELVLLDGTLKYLRRLTRERESIIARAKENGKDTTGWELENQEELLEKCREQEEQDAYNGVGKDGRMKQER